MSVAAQTDRRFRRAHVKPSRRKRNWRALVMPALIWCGCAAGLAYGVVRTSAVAAHAHVLEVEKITVRGNQRLAKGEVLAILSGSQRVAGHSATEGGLLLDLRDMKRFELDAVT